MKFGPVLTAVLLLAATPAAAERLETFNNRLFVPAELNGQPVIALLDSAAEMTVLDDDLAARLGLVPVGSATAHGSGAGHVEARFAGHVRVEVAGVSLELTVAILDLGEVSSRLLGRPVDMLLGRELFDNARLRIDIAGGTIALVDAVPEGAVRLTVAEHRGTPTIPAAIEGSGPVAAVFDLGNGSEVMVGGALAERIGLTSAERIVERRSGGGIGGVRERDIVTLRNLSLAGREFRDVPAAIDPGETASDLNLGTSILRHFIITTDFAERAIWLEPRE